LTGDSGIRDIDGVPAVPTLTADSFRRFMLREARVWGGRVKERRKSLGLTLEQLAELAFTTPQTIHKVEQGQIVPRDHLRLSIAFALAREPEELFPLPSRAAVLREAS
jgi:DNA-binding XRE family transcriptional regulator